MISLSDVEVTFGVNTPLETQALRGVSLNIREGEFVTVIGSNGAGKSSLLNALSGEVSISSGRIEIDNCDVTRLDTSRRAGLVARIFQDPLAGSCEFLSIEENLALADARGRRRSFRSALNEQRKQPYRDYLSRLNLGLEHRLQDKMGLLSGGQRQAVSLLMATLQPSKILLLDEHTAALDPKTSQFVLQLTRQIIEEKKLTALMVTHSMKQALEVGTRTIMLHRGRIIFDIQGPQREGLKVSDLLELFSNTQGEQLDEDALLLG
ncbi:MAG: ABC transporter ATP-binding protein [Gammaproteobacteria bacterium]|nr:ABC transporter ATP-binding protein [Gammaproteobacteria bacterium]